MSRNSDGVKLQLKHLLLFLQYFYPLSVKVNAKTNKVDENRTANIIWLTQLFCTTSYGTYYLFNKLSSQYSTVQLKLIGFMQVDALLTKGLFAFIMAVYHRKTIVTLLNDILSLENVGRKLNFKFGTSNKALLMSILLYIINITFSAHRLSSPMYKGDLRRKMGYVAALLVDVLIPSTNFLFLSLLTLYIDYFKQLNSRLRCALLLDSPSKQLTAIKNVAIFHQKLAEIVNLSTRMLSPICISILCDCMLKITTYIYFFVSLLIYDYPLSYIATAIFYIIEAVIYMLLIVIPCEICMTYANQLQQTLQESTSDVRDKSVLNAIKIVCIQLMHDKLYLSLGGILPLNLPTICTILSAILTYVLFLSQMQEKKSYTCPNS